MTTRIDWKAIGRELMAEERGGTEPPTTEEMIAYTRGELAPEAEARVREKLIAHPELLRAVTAPFPQPAEPGDADYLSDEEYAKHRALLGQRMGGSRGKVVPFVRNWTAIAAAIATLFGVLFIQAEWRARRLAKEIAVPHLAPLQIELRPEGQRGVGDSATTLTGPKADVLFVLSYLSDQTFDAFRVEIDDDAHAGGRPIWSGTGSRRADDRNVVVFVPRAFLERGSYRMLLYGIAGGREQELAKYSIRVP